MKEKTSFCPTGLWLCAERSQLGSVRPKSRIKSKHKVGDNALGGHNLSTEKMKSRQIWFVCVSCFVC